VEQWAAGRADQPSEIEQASDAEAGWVRAAEGSGLDAGSRRREGSRDSFQHLPAPLDPDSGTASAVAKTEYETFIPCLLPLHHPLDDDPVDC
jgi:hypothetical protein